MPDNYNHDHAVKASSDSRTPRSKPGESETARKARGEKESEALALDELLQCLDDDDRTHYTGLTFYIDLETGKIESKERRQARGTLWTALEEGTLRQEHEPLIARAPTGATSTSSPRRWSGCSRATRRSLA